MGPTVIKWDRVLGVPVKSRNAPHGIVLWLFDYERKATRFLLHSATLTNENGQTMPLVFRRTGEWTEFIPPDRWRSHNLGHTYIEEKLDLHIYGERLTLVLDLSVEVDGRVERKKLQFDLRSLKKRSLAFNLPGA